MLRREYEGMSFVGSTDPKQAALELFNQRDFAGAADKYREAIQSEPHAHALHRGLALSLANSGQLDDALTSAQKAAELQPSDAENQYALGFAFGKSGRWAEAIRALDACLYLNPNHGYAKPALVAALVELGKQERANEPREAIKHFDRAVKLDRNNPYALAALIECEIAAGHKGQVVTTIQNADSRIKEAEPVKSLIAKLAQDPEYAVHMKHADMGKQTSQGRVTATTAPPPATAGGPKHVPCPNCRQMIMDFAAICPYCNTKLKAIGTFAHHDRGPDVIWQELALTICSVIWIIMSVIGTIATLQQPSGPSQNFGLTVEGFRFLVGLGFLLRWEWMAFVGKIYLWLAAAGYAAMLLLGAMAGIWVLALIGLVSVCLAGFMIYLVSYCID